jgi:hypothetical protein
MSNVMGFEGYDCAWTMFPENRKAMKIFIRTAMVRIVVPVSMLCCLLLNFGVTLILFQSSFYDASAGFNSFPPSAGRSHAHAVEHGWGFLRVDGPYSSQFCQPTSEDILDY